MSQIDKSTCLSYNNAENELGYRGVPPQAFQSMIDEIALNFAIDLTVRIQPTHTFDFNSQDALYHAALKQLLRKEGFPKGDIDLENKFQTVVNDISLDTIQRGSLRAYSRDSKGNDDKSLIPDALLSWYESEPSSDEICTEELNIDPEEVHTDEE